VMSLCGRSSRLLRYMRGVGSSPEASTTWPTSSPCAFCDSVWPKCLPTSQTAAMNSSREFNGRPRTTTKPRPERTSSLAAFSSAGERPVQYADRSGKEAAFQAKLAEACSTDRMLTEEIDRGHESEVLLAGLDDRAGARLPGEPRGGEAADQVPVGGEAIVRARGQAQVVHAGAGLVLGQAGARGLLVGDAEEGLRVLPAAPADAGTGEEAHPLVDTKAREHVETRVASLSLPADVGIDDRAGEKAPGVRHAVDAEVHGAVDVAQAGEALVDVFLPAAARRDDRAEAPARSAVEIHAGAAEADEETA